MIQVLVGRDLRGESQRVASAFRGALGSGRGLHAAATAAHVLLPLDVLYVVAHLHHVDELRLLKLSLELQEPATAARADSVGRVELANRLDDL